MSGKLARLNQNQQAKRAKRDALLASRRLGASASRTACVLRCLARCLARCSVLIICVAGARIWRSDAGQGPPKIVALVALAQHANPLELVRALQEQGEGASHVSQLGVVRMLQ